MRVWKALLVLVLFLTLLAACGPQAELIEKPAEDMNLTAADLGAGYSLVDEQGIDALKVSMDLPEDEELNDANYRMFETDTGIVLAVVLTLNREVKPEELDELTGGFERGVASELPGTVLEPLGTPSIGDQASMTGAEFADLGAAMYFLGFRKSNVVGVVAVVGLTDMATQELTTQLGQKMAGKITR